MPKKLVLLPAEIDVSELTAAGTVEKDPHWTAVGLENVTLALNGEDWGGAFELVPLPELTAEEQQIVEEHLALYIVVANSARVYAANPGGWESKVRDFDYTLGPGLQFLVEKTGADGALLINGVDYVNSTGRKVAAVLYAAMGVGIPMGQCAMVGGIVDLRTGNLLWLDQAADQTKGFRDPEEARQMVKALLRSHPRMETKTP